MKRTGEGDDRRLTQPPSVPGAVPPLADSATPGYPPPVPGRFWKGVLIGLCLTAAIAYGLYALLS